MSAILLTVKLKGRLLAPQKHVDLQKVTVDVAPMSARKPEFITRVIKFNDRLEADCCRKHTISDEVVHNWIISDCPYWEKVRYWENFTEQQKILSYLNRFDEGLGITFEFIN